MNAQNRPTFTYLGHAAVRCDLPGGEVVLIDPWVDGNPSCPDAAKSFDRVDAILLTHGHSDHVGDAVEIAKRHRPKIVVGTFELCAWLERQGVKNCSGMNIGGSQRVLGTRVTQVQALHTSSIESGGEMLYGDSPTGYVVRLDEGYTFYHAGDTALFMDMQLIAELYRPLLAFLPIGDRFTMDPRQAALACSFLDVDTAIPIHWGTMPILTGTPEAFRDEVARLALRTEVVALRPGESW